MPRKATGQVIEPKDGRTWAIRFRAYGKRRYVALGSAEEGWNRERAEAELRHVLADVERGIWRPYEPAQAPQVAEVSTFHEFASEWLENREPELRPKTVTSYRWQLSGHLLPHFARMHLDRIGPEEIDHYKATKLREGALGPNQINKSLGLLAMILDAAGDYGHIDPARNPARGRRRRVKRTTRAAQPSSRSSCHPCSRPLGGCGRSWRRWPVLGCETARCAHSTCPTSTLPAAGWPLRPQRPMPGYDRSIHHSLCGEN